MQVDLKRRCVLQTADYLGRATRERRDQALGLGNVLGLRHGSGEQHDTIHRRHLNIGLGHRQQQHLTNRVEIAPHPYRCLIHCLASAIGCINGGFARTFGENVKLPRGFDLDIRNPWIADYNVGN